MIGIKKIHLTVYDWCNSWHMHYTRRTLIAPWNACYLPTVWWYCFIYNSSCFLTSAINVVIESIFPRSLHWRHNGHDSVSNHQLYDCLLSRLFGRRSKKTPKLHVTGLCAGNSPETGEFPAQMASNAENVSIWWRHHVLTVFPSSPPALTSSQCISRNTWIYQWQISWWHHRQNSWAWR